MNLVRGTSLACLVACSTGTPTTAPPSVAPSRTVSFDDVSVDGAGLALAAIGSPSAPTLLTADGVVTADGTQAWPGGPVRSLAIPDPPTVAVLVHTDGSLSLYDAARGSTVDVPLEGASVRDAFVLDLEQDGSLETVVTLTDSDHVRAYSMDGTLLWDQRWGGDVDHIIGLRGHAVRVAHTDGIGLVVRTPAGEVVSRNRPMNSGRVIGLEAVHDVGSMSGPSLALHHQKPGASARVDLFSPDGASSLGTVLPDDLLGSRRGVSLDEGLTLTAVSSSDDSVTVRVAEDDETVFSHVLPHRSSWVRTMATDDGVLVFAEGTARRYRVE